MNNLYLIVFQWNRYKYYTSIQNLKIPAGLFFRPVAFQMMKKRLGNLRYKDLLRSKYRTVIQLHYYEDMSVREIAKALNTKESTIKSQLHRARLLLKEYLKGEHDIVW